MKSAQDHGSRKHSRYSASGAERYFECPGSVSLSEGLPDTSNKYSREGTLAHEVLEAILRNEFYGQPTFFLMGLDSKMRSHCQSAASFISDLWRIIPQSTALVETRISLAFIHPEAFGTFDAAIVDYWGTLHVFDFKYGKSPVSPGTAARPNLQMV